MMMTETQTWQCAYCATDYESAAVSNDPWWHAGMYRQPDSFKPRKATCSDPCSKRLSAWKRWMVESTYKVTHGDARRPQSTRGLLNPPSSGLEDAVAPFRVNPDQLTLAA
jgi:hypothetical protein